MDLKYLVRLTGLAGACLAVTCRSGWADETVVINSGPASMVVVTATDEPPQLPPETATVLTVRTPNTGANGLINPSDVAGAQLTLPDAPEPMLAPLSHAEPLVSMPSTLSAPTAPSTSNLSVVANQNHQALLTSMPVDPAVTPASSVEAVDDTRFYGRSPVTLYDGEGRHAASSPAVGYDPGHDETPLAQRPTRVAQRTRAGAAKEGAGKMNRGQQKAASPSNKSATRTAAHKEGTAGRVAKQKSSAPADSALALLVKAHKLSLSASSEAEYSQIVKLCDQAQKRGLQGESLAYGSQLSSWALNRRGQLRADDGQKELAMADFNAALEQDAKNWRALHNRGVTYAQDGQFAEAFDDLCRVVELNPKFAKAYANRATLYVQASDLQDALADYDHALRIDPKLTAALVGRGRVRHVQGKLPEALADLTAGAKLAPKDAEIVCSRADLLTDLGRYNDALDDYARAIDLNPRFEHAFRNGAWLLATCPDQSVRDSAGALAGARAALDCGYGERHAALDTMAAALANAGRYDEAISTVQQAIDVAPAQLRSAYVQRQDMYKAKQPFRMKPVGEGDVETAEFVKVRG